MHRFFKLITIAAAGLTVLAGCRQGGSEVAPEITFTGNGASLASSGISASAAGGDFELTFTSAAPWQISYASDTKALASWIVVTPPAGKGGDVSAVITVNPNETQQARSTRLSLVSGSVSKTIDISQAAGGSIAVSGVILSESALSLYPGESATLAASVTPSYADGDKTVTWSSSAPAVASVSDGVVTALAEGSATITAAVGSVSASCVITVLHRAVSVESVTLDITELTLVEGNSQQLNASVTPEGADDSTPVWTSSDSAVASVSTSGLVTAVSEGSAVITVTAGGRSASCTVTVKSSYVAVESVSLSLSELELKAGETHLLQAVINPSNATEKTVSWSSSDSAVATVGADGLVTAVSKGSAVITATVEGKSASCTVTVVRTGSSGEDLDDPINVNPW